MTKRRETVNQKYDRLNKRIIRQLPVTAAKTMFVWREKRQRVVNYFEIGRDPDSKDARRALWR